MTKMIEIENLSKKYPIRHSTARYGTLRDDMMQFIRHPFAKRTKKEEFWALKDINLTINKGDVVGIIGRNGAGKSTLLKIISGITKPTTGRVKLYGRTSSLLEVGTGFHPELTGRENIFLNGVILGMSRKEVEKKFDEIVAFSGVEKFLDTPVKHYSSGMYVRLAFAVAAHLEPDILIVDEVLAVGDAEFQKKCLGKMDEVAKKEGRTVLFVSHNMGAIEQLCPVSILITSGLCTPISNTRSILDDYIGSRTQNTTEWFDNNRPRDTDVYFNHAMIKHKNCSLNSSVFSTDDEIYVELGYEILRPLANMQIGLRLQRDTTVVFESGDVRLPEEMEKIRHNGRYRSVCTIPSNLLNSGIYSITIFAHIPNVTEITHHENILTFNISIKYPWSGTFTQPGIIRPNLRWQILPELI
ncbi:MAG: ABC transporter ATP-binding protein [Patescibacteria group bacterium]|nr:ABC transporter ATP-binding protein [Patescibacteria group bacterium]